MRHTLKIVIFLMLMLMDGSTICAQSQRLVVWQKNGEKVYYDLAENPKTTFEGTNIVITTSTMSISYPLEQVLRYTYELSSTGVESTEYSKPLRVTQQGDNLVLENLKTGTIIQLYTTDGRLISTQAATDNNATIVSLTPFPSGVYIVKANDVTYKILRR